MVNRQFLRLAFWRSRLAANPLASPCGNQADNQKVVAAETCRILPDVSFLVGPLERHIEHGAFFGLLAPDARTDGTVTDFMDRSEERRVGKECRSRWSPY